MRILVLAFVLISSSAAAQPRPVEQWADWSSYGTAVGNPLSSAIAAWRSGDRNCQLGRLAIAEGLGNGITFLAKRTYASPRPCLGCAPDGMPSAHTMNSILGASNAQWGHLSGWQRWAVSAGLAVATGYLRHEANRHTWRQVAAGALLGAGAETTSQLLRCE